MPQTRKKSEYLDPSPSAPTRPSDLLARQDFKVSSLDIVVDSSQGPCDTNTKEHVDSVGARDVAHRGVSVGILLGGHL